MDGVGRAARPGTSRSFILRLTFPCYFLREHRDLAARTIGWLRHSRCGVKNTGANFHAAIRTATRSEECYFSPGTLKWQMYCSLVGSLSFVVVRYPMILGSTARELRPPVAIGLSLKVETASGPASLGCVHEWPVVTKSRRSPTGRLLTWRRARDVEPTIFSAALPVALPQYFNLGLCRTAWSREEAISGT